MIQTIRKYSLSIGMKFGTERCAMPIMKSGKKRKSRRNRTTKSGKHCNAWREGKLEILGKY